MIEEIGRRLASYRARIVEDANLPRAAVLIPLHRVRDELQVVLTKRTERVEHHKGEISFPGGAMDPEDADLMATALRESAEEIGLLPEHVRLVGRIDDCLTSSRFHIAAFVGEVDPDCCPYIWRPQESEVAEVLEVPLHHLLDRRNCIEVPRQRDGRLVLSEAFQFHDHVIWGATGRILRNFLDAAVEAIEARTAGP